MVSLIKWGNDTLSTLQVVFEHNPQILNDFVRTQSSKGHIKSSTFFGDFSFNYCRFPAGRDLLINLKIRGISILHIKFG